MTTVEDRIEGSLLGLAWGDAFGCPVEGWRAAAVQTVYGVYDRLPDAYPLERIAALGKRSLKRLRPLGLHSDDTQQALALVNVCLAPGGWSKEAWAAWLVAGMNRQAWRGYGQNFAGAVAKLVRGARPEESGSRSAGIGTVMRIGPLGALYRDDPEALARAALESSLTTHGVVRAGAMAYAVARTVALFLAGQTPAEIVARLPAEVEAQETRLLEGYAEWVIDRSDGHIVSSNLAELFAQPLDDAAAVRARVSAMARPHLKPGFTVAHPNQGVVLLGGLHALAMALAPRDDPARVLAEVVALGYDTDTVAAICGSLLGARFGTGWVPRARLLDRPRLEAYARALVARAGPPEDREAFLAREAELTRQEAAFQAALLAGG